MTTLDYEFLYQLTNSAIAEHLSDDERNAIHIKTALDSRIREELEEDNQVILTGSPGDGKSQYIKHFSAEDEFPPSEYYYVMDASERNLEELADEWAEAFENSIGGIVAINDGILNNMIESLDFTESRYEFLTLVRSQLENQIVHSNVDSDLFNSQLLTIDLGNRSILDEVDSKETDGTGVELIEQIVMTLTDDIRPDSRSEAENHAQANAAALTDEMVIETLAVLLTRLEHQSQHVTIRDILNYIAYCITGGKQEPVEDFDVENYNNPLQYYNLALDPDGVDLSNRLASKFDPFITDLPVIDVKIWDHIESSDEWVEYDFDMMREKFVSLKRAALFDDAVVPTDCGGGFVHHFVRQSDNDKFEKHIRGTAEETVNGTFRLLNHYFLGRPKGGGLRVWFDHNYEMKDPDAIVSATEQPTRVFREQIPKLHPELQDTIGYMPSYYVLQFVGSDETKQEELRIDIDLFNFLETGGEEVPTALNDRDLEETVLQFMQSILQHSSDPEHTIMVKNRESGEITDVKLNHDGTRYSIE